PVDKFINAWYQCTQDAIVDETTGQIDFEKLFAARDALTARTSPTVLAKAMPYINRNKNAMIIRAQAVYNTYMNLPKYDGLSKEQAKQVDEFKQEWETLRLASVPNPKQVAAQKFPAGYRMYEARGKQASKARRRFMYRNGKDSSNGYTTNGTLINLFYADLTMADLLEYQPEMASIL
ncbi:MAG TPA: hypothetical protein PLL10_10095, partial [Elusimicrobiales bacterium]|nr:hypothetical protein [Elusimicrobiales bacterium]